MPRPAGVRNRDFEEKRADLVRRLSDHALETDLRRPALRQFAQAVGTSEPTLRHYFGDRQGLIVAVLEHIGSRGTPLWSHVADGSRNMDAAIRDYFKISEAGMRHGGFVRAHAFGLIEGLACPVAGKAYLDHVLSPALDAVRAKLANTPGGPEPGERRAAALLLFAPLLGVSLHQDLLGGRETTPIEIGGFLSSLQRMLSTGLSTDAVPVDQ